MGLAQTMVSASIYSMVRVDHAQEIVLEVEAVNYSARRLYAGLGLTTDKLLPKYYLNGSDAYRMRLEIASVTSPDDPAWDSEIRQVVPPGIAAFWDADNVIEIASVGAGAKARTAAAAIAHGKLSANSFAGYMASCRKRAHLGEQLRAKRIEKRIAQLEATSDDEWKQMVAELQATARASTGSDASLGAAGAPLTAASGGGESVS